MILSDGVGTWFGEKCQLRQDWFHVARNWACVPEACRKRRTNNRTRDLTISSGKECERTVAVADPNLGGSGIEIEEPFFGDFGCGIGGGEDFDANLRGARQKGNVSADLIPTGIKPTDIDSFDAVSGRNRALGQCPPQRSKLNQETNNLTLTLRMAKPGGGVMRICPWRSVSMRSGTLARSGSPRISVQRVRLNPVCGARSGSSMVIGTKEGYAKKKICIDSHPAGQKSWLHRCGVSCPGKVSTVSEGVDGELVSVFNVHRAETSLGRSLLREAAAQNAAQDIRMEFGQISPEKDRPFGVDVSERVR